jgi:hypothetical protein
VTTFTCPRCQLVVDAIATDVWHRCTGPKPIPEGATAPTPRGRTLPGRKAYRYTKLVPTSDSLSSRESATEESSLPSVESANAGSRVAVDD